METTTSFDLNASLSLWLERFAQSPHVRTENVAEMETHVRDSITRLHSQGLSEEESFLIAIRRVGSVGKLEPEFAKLNRNWRNMVIHGLILVFFSVVCWFLWLALYIPKMMQANLARLGVIDQTTGYGALPGFTELLLDCSPFLVVPPLLALVYCLYALRRKSNVKTSWMGFFAATTCVILLLGVPIILGVMLPFVRGFHLQPR